MRLLTGVVVALALAAAWLLGPPPALETEARPPAAGYDAAVARIERLGRRDTIALHPGCQTAALLHGRRTPRAIVLVHGLTNCPLQFRPLGERLHAGGDNVLVPRVDHHGLADRMTEDLALLTARELSRLTRECVDIAGGLGDTIVVMGLSSGGVMAAWAAQRLDGVDRAIVLAPTFAPPWGQAWATPLLTRAALRLPNTFVWWDDDRKADLPGPVQCYPRFATRAIAAAYRMAQDVTAALAREPARAREIVVVTTAADDAVDNAVVDAVAARWRARGARVRRVAFPAGLAVPHDMVDPTQVGARPEIVHPVLIALARGEAVDAGGGGAPVARRDPFAPAPAPPPDGR